VGGRECVRNFGSLDRGIQRAPLPPCSPRRLDNIQQ
jgi:hypothetical protein